MLAMLASPACAQDAATASTTATAPTTTSSRVRYEPEFFKPFAPSTALDIVRRVPGFSIDGGDRGVRGFGGAAGNVVINGARQTSKSDDIGTILSRIPANRVLAVEIGSGELFGSDFAGRAQVVNVLLSAAGGLAGTADVAVSRVYTGKVAPTGSISALVKRGRSTFNLSGNYERFWFPDRGTDRLTRIEPGVRLGDGEQVELRVKDNNGRNQDFGLSGSWAYAGGDNRVANVNFRVSDEHFKFGQTNDVFVTDRPPRDDALFQDSLGRRYELGGDVTRPLWGGGVKLIGLATRRSGIGLDTELRRVGDDLTGGFEQASTSRNEETVVRLLWSRPNVRGWNVEVGAEGALNKLDYKLNLFGIDPAGARSRIDLPVDEAVVTEYRGEAFVNVGRKLSPTLRVDAGLTYEASRLTVRGDTRAARSLQFPKPSLTLDWRPNKIWHAQFGIKRTVAQLDFFDFVSSAELSSERIDAGNAELLPQRAWETRLTIDRPILGNGTAKIEIGYDSISKLQDRVPTPEGFDAPGNLATGRKAFVNTTIDAPLGRLGIKGGRLNFNVLGQHTAVRDPYTGRNRRFSGALEWDINAEYRQDLGRYAYGLSWFAQPNRIFYRRNETDESNSDETFFNAFAEYRPTSKSTLSFSIDNVLDNPSRRFRTFYDPDRTNLMPSIYEDRVRQSGRRLTVRYKRNFG